MSTVIALGDLEKLAQEIEEEQKKMPEPEPPKKRKASGKKKVVEPQVSPGLLTLSQSVVTLVSRVCHEHWKWTDPGKIWEQETGTALASVLEKYLPDTEYSEEVFLLLLVGSWVGPNLMVRRAKNGTDHSASGDDGQRKDVEGSGTGAITSPSIYS